MRTILKTLAAGTSLAALAYLLWPQARSEAPKGLVVVPSQGYAEGKLYRYQVEYHSDDLLVPFAIGSGDPAQSKGLESSLHLSGTLEVQRLSVPEDTDNSQQTLSFKLSRCDSANFSLLGQIVWEDALECQAATQKLSLQAEFSNAGELLQVYDAPEQDSTASMVLQSLALSLQHKRDFHPYSPGQSWHSHEESLLGKESRKNTLISATNGYEIKSDLENFSSLRAESQLPIQKQKHSGESEIRINRAGVITSLDKQLDLQAESQGTPVLSSSLGVKLKLLEIVDAPTATLPKRRLVARSPFVARSNSQADQQILDQRIAGLTRRQIKMQFASYGNSGQFPDHDRFLWRLSGYYTKYPEQVKDLVQLFQKPNASHKLHGLVLDVLASVGHTHAQAAMLEALGKSPNLQERNTRMLYQRLGLVDDPGQAIENRITGIYRQHQDSSLEEKLVSAYSLGAMAGKLASSHPERASEYRSWLLDDLSRAETQSEELHLIRALGAANGPELPEKLADYTLHENSQVRAAVASALARVPNHGGKAALMELMQDDDLLVQRASLQGLSDKMDSQVLDQLTDFVQSGNFDSMNLRPLLQTLSRVDETFISEKQHLLQALLAKGIDDPGLRQVAMTLLRS